MKNIYQTLFIFLWLSFSFNSIAQPPVYSSLPGAAPTIFLDFDGQTVNGTQWNAAGSIVAGPANLNNDQITEIFNRIAEDYRPFTVNVTTDSTKYLAAPVKQRVRVIFTVTSAWYPQAVGGISYINSFSWGDNTPCWVFTAALGYNIKNISEAGAHEAGHTLGLRHQALYDANCHKITDYNSGTGTGEIGWAPIMGVGYSKNFTTWNLGPNPTSCSTMQNDLDVITGSSNGITFRMDDYPETFAGAAAAPFINDSMKVTGIITKSTDKDMFKFTVSQPGHFILSAVPYNVGAGNKGSDLDMRVQLFDSAQNQIGNYNPAPLLNAVIDTTLDADTYYLLVSGTGNQFASEYGSLGSYSLQGSFKPIILPPLAKFELKGSNDKGLHKFSWEVISDTTIAKQVLEVSANGNDFHAVAGINKDDRTYSYYPNATSSLLYRLRITFDNHRKYYSNGVTIRNNQTKAIPHLFRNIITSDVLRVTSPSKYSYTITDLNNNQFGVGVISEGATTLHFTLPVKGVYLIHFNNEQEQYVEKFIKQ